MKNKTFGDKIKFFFRKLIISLKRNYYIIPLLFVMVGCAQLLCSLYILSPALYSIPQSIDKYACIFIFVASLFVILDTVAYLNYAIVKYGKKRPLFMLIIYFIMWAIVLFLMIRIYIATNLNYLEDKAAYESLMAAGESAQSIEEKLQLMNNSLVAMGREITQIVIQCITIVVVLTAPLVQKALKKIKFKAISEE